MKKLLSLTLVGIMSILLCACGVNNTGSSNNHKALGTRDNPYKIGDTIEIANIYQDEYYNEAWNGIPFTLTLTINDVVSKKELIDAKNDPSIYNLTYPVVDITFRMDGDYSDVINENKLFQMNYLTDGMIELFSNYTHTDVQTGADFRDYYTGVDYNIYENLELNEVVESNLKYCVISYYDEEMNQCYVYVDIESKEDSEEVETTEEAAISKEELSPEEETYLLAQEAMNNNQYGYALRLFNDISDYKDSANYITSLHTIVDMYNGEYTVEMFSGGTYSMVINNGIVTTQINGVDGALLYYFELFGFTYDDGTTGMAMGNASDYDSDGIIDTTPSSSYEGDERYSIKSMDNGELMIMALEGNNYTYWNGSTK